MFVFFLHATTTLLYALSFVFGLDPGTEYRMFFGTSFAGQKSDRKNSNFLTFTTKGQAKVNTVLIPLEQDPNVQEEGTTGLITKKYGLKLKNRIFFTKF